MFKIPFNNQKNNQGKNPHSEIFISPEWFSQTFLSTGDAVIATDQVGTITSMNKVAEELTGWNMAESVGKPIDDIFDAINETTHLPVENPVNKALKENKIILLANHTILIKKDKTERNIVDSAVPIHNENAEVIGGALIFRDVTAQTLSNKKLAESEALLKGILENSNLIVDIKNLEGNYLMINSQKEKVYNIKANDLIGKNSSTHLTKEEQAESGSSDLEAIKQKRTVQFEFDMKLSDGTWHSYHVSKFPLFDSDKKIYAVCTISTDISEVKKNIELQEQLAIQEIALKSDMRFGTTW